MGISQAFLNCASSIISPSGHRGRLLILIYHRVLQLPDPMRPGEVDAEMFEWQMQLMLERFNVIPLSAAYQKLQEGKLPSRAACITFDDGYADNADIAVPILKNYGLQATFFVSSGFLDGGRMWNDTVIEAVRRTKETKLDLTDINLGCWVVGSMEQRAKVGDILVKKLRHIGFDDRMERVNGLETLVGEDLPANLMLTTEKLRYMSAEGMEIGAHTVNHPILTCLDDERAKWEIGESKIRLEEITGCPVDLFAYPNGRPEVDYDQRHVEMVRNAGYSAAVSTHWGAAKKSSDMYQLPRFTPWHSTPEGFHQALVRSYFW